MSELHTYRIHYGHVPLWKDERAFTAEDALTQWRTEWTARGGDVPPNMRIEPLPDAPEPRLSEKQREWIRVLDETTGTIPGLTVEAWRLHELERRIAKLEAAPQNVPAPEGLRPKWAGVNLTPLEQTARAATPEDRIEALGAALRERTAEMDRAQRADRDHFEQMCALINAIEGRPDTGIHIGPDLAARMARETREQRDSLIGQIDGLREHLRARTEERDELKARLEVTASTLEGQNRRVEELQSERDEDRKVSQARLEALCKIGWVAWPEGASRGYALSDLVEAVRKMGAERDTLQRMNEAGSTEVVAEMAKTREAAQERDAIQKRIDAAKAWICAARDGADMACLLAILEGREP